MRAHKAIGIIGLTLLLAVAPCLAESTDRDLQSGVDNLVKQLADSMEKQSLTTVAILDLVNLDQSVSNLGRYIAERANTGLHRTGKFTVIERDLLERTLNKLNLTIPDLADPANVQLLAKTLNIQALAKGTVSDLGETIEINMRVVRAISNAGEVIAVAQTAIRKDEQIGKLMGQVLSTVGSNSKSRVTAPSVTGKTGGELKIDLGQGIIMEFVLIQPGEFDMGSPVMEEGRGGDEHLHRVRITKPFYIGKYEVTQAQWAIVMGGNPGQPRVMNGPVNNISWTDCKKFLAELSRLVPGKAFRLPTEAEWEYACRAGATTRYCFGDDEGGLGAYAWYMENSDKKIHEVGKTKPNAWGLYDMHGNVWEWCEDRYGKYEFSSGEISVDPNGPSSGDLRVLRGGSFVNEPGLCRCAFRGRYEPPHTSAGLGFRVVVGVAR